MARRNPRPSVDPSSRYLSETPGPTADSDAENRDPREMSGKGKGRARDNESPVPSLPTPSSEEQNESARGQKRKRVQMPRKTQDKEDDDFNKYYDPNQDPEVRRQIKRKSRALERTFIENREELLRNTEDGITPLVHQINDNYRNVKQTGDATMDSKLLVNVTDIAYKRTSHMLLGDTSIGVDMDEFLSKCITFMRGGAGGEDGAASNSRRRQSGNNDDDSDKENEENFGEPLDWEALGRHACFPYNTRPPVPSFLLGPLSVEKKVRNTQRRARQTKDNAGREANPEALTREDLSQSDENGLTTICTRIRNHLVKHVEKAEAALERAGITDEAQLQEDYGKELLKKARITDAGGPSLFEYAVNPHSFGQTVENLFYISFLIKEGSIGISADTDGLPTINPTAQRTIEERRQEKASRHQAVFSMDYSTWQKLVDAYGIKEPMIPHREEEAATQVGNRGWYA